MHLLLAILFSNQQCPLLYLSPLLSSSNVHLLLNQAICPEISFKFNMAQNYVSLKFIKINYSWHSIQIADIEACADFAPLRCPKFILLVKIPSFHREIWRVSFYNLCGLFANFHWIWLIWIAEESGNHSKEKGKSDFSMWTTITAISTRYKCVFTKFTYL